MELRKPRPGELLAGVSGAVLLLSMVLPWYEATVVARAGGVSVSRDGWLDAWEAFALLDLPLALTGVAAIALAAVGATQRTPAIPIAAASLVTLVALPVAALLLARVISIPEEDVIQGIASRTAAILPDGIAVEGRDVSRGAGAWVGLAACLGVLAGGLAAMRDEGLGRRAGRWRPSEESSVAVTTLPPPRPRSESGNG